MPDAPSNPKDMADMLEAIARKLRADAARGGSSGSHPGTRMAVSLPETGSMQDGEPSLGAIDMFADGDSVTVTAETRNADAQSVHVSVAEGRLFIGVGDGSHAVRRDLALPAPVDEEAAFATFRNGILDVTLPIRRK